MHNLPFDLGKMDYKAVRKLKRKKLLKYSIVPVVLVSLLALWFILPHVLTQKAIGEYKHGNFSGARQWLSPLTVTSPEPFVIAFNSGTVDTKLGKYDRAEKELTRAVAIAPPTRVCMAAQNLVISLKTHAAIYNNDKSKEATELLTKAKLVMEDHADCFKGASSSGGGGGSNSAAQSQSPSDSQQQQLKQKEQEGRDRQSKYASEEQYDPNNPELKPW